VSRPKPLPESELRSLVKASRSPPGGRRQARLGPRAHDRELSALAFRRAEAHRVDRSAKARLASATRTLDEHDRPFGDATTASRSRRQEAGRLDLPASIEHMEQELAALPEMVEAERAANAETIRTGDRPATRSSASRSRSLTMPACGARPLQQSPTNASSTTSDRSQRIRLPASSGSRLLAASPSTTPSGASPPASARRPHAAARQHRAGDHLLCRQPRHRRPRPHDRHRSAKPRPPGPGLSL
jgi:hypothetical protein